MKSKILLAGLIALLIGCCNKKADTATLQADNQQTPTQQPVENNAVVAPTYQGVYEGLLPTASGSGMKVVVTISEGLYQKSVEYLEEKNSKPIITKGEYSWNAADSVITLLKEPKNTPNKYWVVGDKIYQLNLAGNKITGMLAEDYALKKQMQAAK